MSGFGFVIGEGLRSEIATKFNKYRAGEEARAAFRALITKQTLHQTTIDAVDQALELAFLAGAVAGHEILIDKLATEEPDEAQDPTK